MAYAAITQRCAGWKDFCTTLHIGVASGRCIDVVDAPLKSVTDRGAGRPIKVKGRDELPW